MKYSIHIPDDLYSELKEESSQKNITVAGIIKLICSEYFKKAKKKPLFKSVIFYESANTYLEMEKNSYQYTVKTIDILTSNPASFQVTQLGGNGFQITFSNNGKVAMLSNKYNTVEEAIKEMDVLLEKFN